MLCFDFVGNKFISSTSVFQFHACLRQFYTLTSDGEDPLVDAEETDKGMLDEKIAVNFASKDQLMSVPGIGEKIASAILSVRESSGNITKPVLNLLTKNTLPAESWSRLDFQLNTSLDPGMIIDESVKFKHPSTLSGIDTTPTHPGLLALLKDFLWCYTGHN